MSVPLSLVVTTLDNERTLPRCLDSVPFADEIVVLDSGSKDTTKEIAISSGAAWFERPFAGYGPQKARAVELATHDWVLLLDADEELSPELASEIQQLLKSVPPVDGYRLLREEWLYWRWPAAGTRLTDHLRLFDRRRMVMSRHPVHSAPTVTGRAATLRGRLRHHGHENLHGQVERINAYTTGSTGPRGQITSYVKLLLAPPAAFLRDYVLRRQFLNGWAGFIASRTASFHAFLRHAKQIEAQRRGDGGDHETQE